MAILEALREAGALNAELIVIWDFSMAQLVNSRLESLISLQKLRTEYSSESSVLRESKAVQSIKLILNYWL